MAEIVEYKLLQQEKLGCQSKVVKMLGIDSHPMKRRAAYKRESAAKEIQALVRGKEIRDLLGSELTEVYKESDS